MIQKESLSSVLKDLLSDNISAISIDLKDESVRIDNELVTFKKIYDFNAELLPRLVVMVAFLDDFKSRNLLFKKQGNIIIESDNKSLLIKNVDDETVEHITKLLNAIKDLRVDGSINDEYKEFCAYNIINNYVYLISDKSGKIIRKIKSGEMKDTEDYKQEAKIVDIDRINDKIINGNKDIFDTIRYANRDNIHYDAEDFEENYNRLMEYYQKTDEMDKYLVCGKCINNKELKGLKGEKKMARNSIVDDLRNVKKRNDFASIIKNPIEEPEHLFTDSEHEELSKGAAEQARMLLEITKERDQIKKDAEEFAKTILEKQKERRQILRAAEEQARRIIALERENDELKKLAEENARIIFDRDLQTNKQIARDANEYAKIILAKQQERNNLLKAAQEQAQRIIALEKENNELRRLAEENAKNLFNRENKYRSELKLREMVDTEPLKNSDVDKLYALLNALVGVEELPFAVNHPTVMQHINELEHKVEAYLSTHKVVEDEIEEVVITETENKQTNTELLDILRNAYTESHNYEKEGRHSVINVTPEDDKIKVTLYSVKNDTDDILTEVFFDEDFFDDNTIKALCEIYSSGCVIVASKTDNIPGNLQDYLVIDNQDNAIKFMGCKKDIVERAKAYL